MLAAEDFPAFFRALALDVAANAQATWRLLGYSDDMADELLRQQRRL